MAIYKLDIYFVCFHACIESISIYAACHVSVYYTEVLNSLFQTTFFSVLFLLCLGMILYINGIGLLSIRSGFVSHSLNLQFAGALLATLSWVSVYIYVHAYVHKYLVLVLAHAEVE